MLGALRAHPALQSAPARFTFSTITIMRALFAVAFTVLANRLIEFGTATTVVGFCAAAGVICGSILSFSRLRSAAPVLGLGIFFLMYRALFGLADTVNPLSGEHSLALFALLQHADLAFYFFAFFLLSSWSFWRFEVVCTLESVLICAISIYLFSGHRNFHLDTPSIISSMAWFVGVEHLTMLIMVGVIIIALALGYLLLATIPTRPVARLNAVTIRSHHPGRNAGSRLAAAGLCGTVVFLISQQIYSHYSILVATRTANGVGQEQTEGISPLGFHSALGTTNQPSALVRLEGDYSANPFTPMMYLRESALSTFNGYEMVLAPPEFDSDISRTGPEEAFTGTEDATLEYRTPLTQSVFLLTDHDSAFALDYPLTLTRLKNPDPSRFKAAYRAYSIAPAFGLEQLREHPVGDPRWSPEVRQHYLKTHTDSRYTELAQQLTANITDPVARVSALVGYLNANAIYTLTPNHDVPKGQDPVAPFLFGDKRGYCVHFAHATVYMARALGIPARIGTGYLTDLSQAKDGHILLRMSDRHAWAEIYVQSFGWVPFDTQPEHVESHAESAVDMKLLEELMGAIGPGEEILPKETGKEEIGLQEPRNLELPGARVLAVLAALALLIAIVSKLYLRYGWLLPASNSNVLRRAYRALISQLADVGVSRARGETRQEFRQRLSAHFKTPALTLTEPYNLLRFSKTGAAAFSNQQIREILKHDLACLQQIPRWKRLLGWLLPGSALLLLSRRPMR
ncbi:MAG: transglutaminase domain-containing protein [Oligoflexia bacterium]|nr:transglutaminase domain-containing protein [Oligoflexia bacterium]